MVIRTMRQIAYWSIDTIYRNKWSSPIFLLGALGSKFEIYYNKPLCVIPVFHASTTTVFRYWNSMNDIVTKLKKFCNVKTIETFLSPKPPPTLNLPTRQEGKVT